MHDSAPVNKWGGRVGEILSLRYCLTAHPAATVLFSTHIFTVHNSRHQCKKPCCRLTLTSYDFSYMLGAWDVNTLCVICAFLGLIVVEGAIIWGGIIVALMLVVQPQFWQLKGDILIGSLVLQAAAMGVDVHHKTSRHHSRFIQNIKR